ncbi:MAG: FAD-dependent oxidoreductase, partial [Pseudomonadota bacterium]|nr:FAD-dependent oxidoreductase [Pseudomonadota bacterium]
MTPIKDRRGLWIGALLLALLAVGLYFYFDLGRLLTIESLKSSRDSLLALYQRRPLATLATFFAIYVAVVALSVPGATMLTLAAGTIFGIVVGVVMVSFAASLGALLAFLIARYLLRDTVQAHFGKRLAPIDEGMRRDGAFYLLTLRLVPVFPFFLVNLLSALTSIGALRFYWVTQLGALPGTAVYVNAGTQLASIDSPGDILSPVLLLSFVLLGLLPWVGKAVVGMLRGRTVYARWTRPKRFDRNLVVIGAGAGGLVTAYIAAAVKAKVTLVEAHRMGGDCLNFGCVPSKALIRSARLVKEIREGGALGVTCGSSTVDFAAAMARVHSVIAAIAPHDSVERYRALGVDVILGAARITSPWAVEIVTAEGSKTLTTRSIVIAAGASPTVPSIPGLDDVGYLTSDTVWDLKSLPRRLVVLGGGPVG